MKGQLGKLLVIGGLSIGLLFGGAALYFYYLSTVDLDNPARHEYALGIGIGLMWSAPAFIAASIGAYLDKERLSRYFTYPLHLIAISICLAFGYLKIRG